MLILLPRNDWNADIYCHLFQSYNHSAVYWLLYCHTLLRQVSLCVCVIKHLVCMNESELMGSDKTEILMEKKNKANLWLW